MTTSCEVKCTGTKNLTIQLYVDGGRKNKKADPICVKPGESTDIKLWPGIAMEIKEEQQDEEIDGGEPASEPAK